VALSQTSGILLDLIGHLRRLRFWREDLKNRKKGGRIGTLLFFIPVILIMAVVVYAIVSATGSQNGTLVVEAQSSGQSSHVISLAVAVSVNGQKVTTPATLTLSQGTYTVTFSGIPWYVTPPTRVVLVPAAKTSYAVGTYDPIEEFVSVNGGSFNRTSLSVLHGVTPVVWINPSSTDQVIYSPPMGKVDIPPMQNFTYVFPQKGTFVVYFPAGGSGSVDVSAQ